MINEIFARGQTPSGRGWYTVSGLAWDRANGFGEAYLSYAYGAAVTEVEVDLETGQVSVDKFVAVHDVGHAFDKSEVIGQINGGVSMAVGMALFEDVDSKKGHIRNTNFDKYLIPTILDMPEMDSIVVEVPTKTGPFGARGLGEPTACTAAPAIINAIYDATGIRIRELPASLETMMLELRNSRNKTDLD
jgi:CO/xanthine dehydrogenase Mo-binding subunit